MSSIWPGRVKQDEKQLNVVSNIPGLLMVYKLDGVGPLITDP